jgi:hypothetical protein
MSVDPARDEQKPSLRLVSDDEVRVGDAIDDGASVEPGGLTAEAAYAVRLSLSRYIGDGSGYRTFTHQVSKVLAAYGGKEVIFDEGHGVFVDTTWPGGETPLNRLSMAPAQLDDQWAIARARKDELLPDSVLMAFFPEELWEPLFGVIADGPVEAAARVEGILSCWARGLRINETRRPAGPVSEASITSQAQRIWRLMRIFCALKKREAFHGLTLFKAWDADHLPPTPSGTKLKAAPANNDRSAPPLLSARRVWRRLREKIEMKEQYSKGREQLFTDLRNRALLGVCLSLGLRRQAIAGLNVGSFLEDHIFPDGSRGPALRAPGVKGFTGARIKAIPAEVTDAIRAYIDYAGIADDKSSPLWRPNRLDIRHKRLTSEAIFYVISRLFESETGRSYSIHSLRHLAEKLGYVAGIEWIAQNRERILAGDYGLPASPQTFADVLLDHKLHDVTDRYKDISSERGREIWCRITVDLVWELVAGDLGARKGQDLEWIDDATKRLAAAEQTRERHEERIKQLEQQMLNPRSELDTHQLLLLIAEAMREARLLSQTTAARERAAAELAQAREASVPVDDYLDEVPTHPEDAVTIDEIVEPKKSEFVTGWVTPSEFICAHAPGLIKPSTLRNWMNGTLTYKAGDRRNLWDPPGFGKEYPDPIERKSERKFRIHVNRLDPTRFQPEVVARLNALAHAD